MHSNSTIAIARWTIAFIIVVTLHIGFAALLLTNWQPIQPPEIPAAVMIELSPFAESPNNKPTEDPAPVTQDASNPTPVEPEPEPIKEPEPLPEPPVETPQPKVVIQKPKPIKKPRKKPIEKPIEKPKEITNDTKPKADVTSTASTVGSKLSDRTAAPATTASNTPSRAQINWQARLMSRLLRYKRYPNQARFKRQEGQVIVDFTINAQGKVLAKKITKSSGHPLLDQEVLRLVDRAQPLPLPPADVLNGKTSINIEVPINFSLRDR